MPQPSDAKQDPVVVEPTAGGARAAADAADARAAAAAAARNPDAVLAKPYDIRLGRPYMDEAIKARVLEVLDSGWLTEGDATYLLQKRVAAFVGATHGIAATSCTTGMEAIVRGWGLGPGDEAIVPSYTYPASATAITSVGATAVLVDVDPSAMVVDLDAVRSAITPRTKAVVGVSLFGNALPYDELRAICDEHDLRFLEDAACGLGMSYRGRMCGAIADASVFSMHPRKTLTTGEGGLITTDDDDLAEWLRVYRNFGSRALPDDPRGFEFQVLGTNLKLSNVLAAVGLGQFDHLDQLLATRRRVAAAYRERLADVPGIELAAVTPGCEHAYQSFPILVPDRDRIRQELRAIGIEVQVGSYALHRHAAFASGGLVRLHGDLTGASHADDACLVLPLHQELTDADLDAVCRELTARLPAAR